MAFSASTESGSALQVGRRSRIHGSVEHRMGNAARRSIATVVARGYPSGLTIQREGPPDLPMIIGVCFRLRPVEGSDF